MLERSALAVLLGAAALHATPALAQAPKLLVAAGYGLSAPTVGGADGSGEGGYAAVEALSEVQEWLARDLYAGLVLTWPEGGCGPGVAPCDVSARIFFLGIKARVMAPIPWVGPFGEIGAGLSLGTLTTRSGNAIQAEARGVMPHWQFAVGLAIGPHHEFSLAFHAWSTSGGSRSAAGSWPATPSRCEWRHLGPVGRRSPRRRRLRLTGPPAARYRGGGRSGPGG